LSAKRPRTYGVDIYRADGTRTRIVVGPNRVLAIELSEKAKWQRQEQRFDPTPRPIRFSKLADAYLERAEGTNGYRTARCIFRRLCDEWGHLKTSQITPGGIESLRTKMLREGKSKRWIDYHTALARSAYNLARLPNPFKSVKQFNPDTRVVRYLSRDERKALLTVLPQSPVYLSGDGPRYLEYWPAAA
jgi:hypothetical protein